jgi:hypothetical protein
MDELNEELSTYCIFHGNYSKKYGMCPECKALALDSYNERAKDRKRGMSICWSGISKDIYIRRLPR